MKKKIFTTDNFINAVLYLILLILALSCLLPFLNIVAISLSGKNEVAMGQVSIIPKNFNLESYEFVFKQKSFWASIKITVYRVILGGIINFILTILTAYPLSKTDSEFKGRTIYAWFMFFTTIVSGGLIPYYFLIYNVLHINNTIFALILPTALPVFNVIILINFFRGIPRELGESARLDGAGNYTILFLIYVPLSLAPLATVTLFSIIMHWNSWFDGIIYMDETIKYPLASYLQKILIEKDSSMSIPLVNLTNTSTETKNAAQIFLGMLPILIVYPFIQKYFEKGILIGSVKG